MVYSILNENYMGSVSSKAYKETFNYEKKNNFHLFKVQILRKYNTRKRAYTAERKLHIHLDVVHNPLYFNKAIANSKHNRGDVSIPITQLTLDGEFIKHFKSSMHCGRVLKINPSNIGACLRNRTDQAYGFVWIYKKDYDPNKDYSTVNAKYNIYLQFDKLGNFIDEIRGKGDIQRELNLKTVENLNPNKMTTQGGFYFILKSEYDSVKEIFHSFVEGNKPTWVIKYYNSIRYVCLNNAKNKEVFIRRYNNREYYSGKMIFKIEEWENFNDRCQEEWDTNHQIYLSNIPPEKKKINNILAGIRRLKFRGSAPVKIGRPKLPLIPIVRLNLNGDYISTYGGFMEASNDTGIHKDNIISCLANQQKYAGDSQFYYESEYNDNKDIGKNVNYNIQFPYLILQLNKETLEILKIFSSSEEAKRNFEGGDINAVLRDKQKTSNSFRWVEIRKPEGTYDKLLGLKMGDIKDLVIRPKSLYNTLHNIT